MTVPVCPPTGTTAVRYVVPVNVTDLAGTPPNVTTDALLNPWPNRPTLAPTFQRDFDGVIAVLKNILQRDPNYHLGYSMLTTGYYCERRWDDWQTADAKVSQGEFWHAMSTGHPDEVGRALGKVREEAQAGARRPYDVGHFALLAGNRSLALEWLEKS